jgi:hypothetical protein
LRHLSHARILGSRRRSSFRPAALLRAHDRVSSSMAHSRQRPGPFSHFHAITVSASAEVVPWWRLREAGRSRERGASAVASYIGEGRMVGEYPGESVEPATVSSGGIDGRCAEPEIAVGSWSWEKVLTIRPNLSVSGKESTQEEDWLTPGPRSSVKRTR